MEISEILEKIALPARSNKNGFKNIEKLEAINELIETEGSPYHLLWKGDNVWIYGQRSPHADEHAVLVSSHADIVPEITKVSSSLDDEGYFHGTYDNLGTNAAAVSLMLNGSLPKNVYFAFTSEEETGKCLGAKWALHYIQMRTKRLPMCVALDVTDEGYKNDRLFTLEAVHGKSNTIRNRIVADILATEGESQSFELVRLKRKDEFPGIDTKYLSKYTAEFDEGSFYAKQGGNSFSICLPCTGHMHSNSGLYIKEAVMKGYIVSLQSVLFAITKNKPELIEENKKIKDDLVNDALHTERKTFSSTHPSYSSYSSYSSSSFDYDAWKAGGGAGSYQSRYKSITDYIDEYQDGYPKGLDAYYSDDDFYWDDEDARLDMMERMVSDGMYETASYYNKDEYDVFFEDMVHEYGVDRYDPKVRKIFKEVWDDTHYEEDYDNEEYE